MFQSEIEKLIGNKEDKTEIVSNIFFFLMNEMKQPYSECLNIPIPLVFELMKIMKKQVKEMEKKKWQKR